MTYSLTIPGRLPDMNDYSDAERAHWRKAAQMKRETQDFVGWAIKRQLPGLRIERPVAITFAWYEPNRRRDKDNIAFAKKFIQDALVEAGVLANDGWRNIVRTSDSVAVDASNPRVEVWIEEVGEDVD
ncbi:MAG: hypothetical protein ABFE02_16490 [Sulfuricella sp.]